MAFRVKWYSAAPLSSATLPALLEAFVKDEYSSRRKWGFTNVISQGQSIKGQFIERVEKKLQTEDPFGKILEFRHVEFTRQTFTIRLDPPHFELLEPSRSQSNFFTRIAEYLDFKIAIAEFQIDVLKWVLALESQMSGLELTAAVLVNIGLSNTAHAKVWVAGTAEVRPSLKKLLGSRCFDFAKVQVRGTYRSQLVRYELYHDGRVALIEGPRAELLNVIRSAIPVATVSVG